MRVPIAALVVALVSGTQAAGRGAPPSGVSAHAIPAARGPARSASPAQGPASAGHYVHTIARRDTLIGVSFDVAPPTRRSWWWAIDSAVVVTGRLVAAR